MSWERCVKRKKLFEKEFKNYIGMKWSFDCKDNDTVLIDCPSNKVEEFVKILNKFGFKFTNGVKISPQSFYSYNDELKDCYIKDKHVIGICRIGLGGSFDEINKANCVWFPHGLIRKHNVKYVCDYKVAKIKLAKIHKELRRLDNERIN